MSEQATQTSHELIEEFIAARNARDRERIAALLTDDVEWVLPRSHERESPTGPDAVDALAGGLTGTVFDLATIKREVKRITAEGDVVAVEQTMSGTTLDGKDYSNEYVWIYELREGRIARIFEHMDTLILARVMDRT
jgi:ketosteroid isomerase-like protein